MPTATHQRLRTGDDYRASLRDGREVWHRGERIEDVTAHPATAGGVDLIAAAHDAHLAPETADALTFVREDGVRLSKAWMVPRSRDDLRARRECVEALARASFGVFGRQMDMISATQVGMVAHRDLIAAHCPDHAGNIVPYVERAAEEQVILAAPLADPQGWRSRGIALGRGGIPVYDDGTGAGDLGIDLRVDGTVIPSVLRVVRSDADGVWISGAKVVGSLAPQCQELLVSNIALPDLPPESAIWALVPVASPGVRLVCRETTVPAGASSYDHPIAARGEEADALVLFEDVFVPHERVCALGWTGLARAYGDIAALEHWHTLTRMCVKAELFVGLLQLICDGIGTSHRPGVRQLVAEVIEYAQILRGMVLASEEAAAPTPTGVMWPDTMAITAGRSFALSRYAHIVHLLQELAGQGPILRWSEDDLDHPLLGPRLAWLYEGAAISARDKNLLMNLLWDLTASSHAGRVTLFEGVNGFPVPYLRERLYREYDRERSIAHVEGFLGIGGAA